MAVGQVGVFMEEEEDDDDHLVYPDITCIYIYRDIVTVCTLRRTGN